MSIERDHLFYMANLGSEISRYLDCVTQSNIVEAKRAWERVERINAALLLSPATSNARLEIEMLVNFVAQPEMSGIAVVDIKRECGQYFMPFALRMLSR